MHPYHSYFHANVCCENVKVYNNLIAYTSNSYGKICRRFQVQRATSISLLIALYTPYLYSLLIFLRIYATRSTTVQENSNKFLKLYRR